MCSFKHYVPNYVKGKKTDRYFMYIEIAPWGVCGYTGSYFYRGFYGAVITILNTIVILS